MLEEVRPSKSFGSEHGEATNKASLLSHSAVQFSKGRVESFVHSNLMPFRHRQSVVWRVSSLTIAFACKLSWKRKLFRLG